jgi:hypothetical protein
MSFPGQLFDCPTNTIWGLTDATGTARFTIVGAGKNTGAVGSIAAPGPGLGCVHVYSYDPLHYALVGELTAVILDQNGAVGGNGVNATDLAYLSDDLGSAALNHTYRGRSDYNFDGVNNALDLGVYTIHLGEAVLGTGSGLGCPGAMYCP